jgi:hypothetical protein
MGSSHAATWDGGSVDGVEARFWQSLEFRVCAEFSGFEDAELRHYWCDGLVPDKYDLQADEPCIGGTAFCGRTGQDRWRFILLVGDKVSSAAEINWSSLLPAADMTGWMSPHRTEQILVLDPRAAVPD